MGSFFEHSAVVLTPEQEEVKAIARQVANEVARPRAADVDKNRHVEEEAVKAYKDSGLMSLAVPREIGGKYCGLLGMVVAFEELGVACGSSSLYVNSANVGYMPVLYGGTKKQQEAVFELTQAGKGIANFSITEPHAGSDVAAIASQAKKDGNTWTLNGTKSLVELAGIADITSTFIKTDPEGGNKGITCFAVPTDTDGFEMVGREDTMGMRGIPMGELKLNDVKVGDEWRMGELGQGFDIAMGTVLRSRIGSAGTMMGIARGALEYATNYANERQIFGQAVSKFQGIRFMIAEMAMRLESARAMTYSAARMLDEDKADRATKQYFSAVSKCYATDMCMSITTDAVQILGGWGYTRRHPLERMMRDAKSMQLGDGSNQIQRVIMSRELIRRLGEKSSA